jgi:FAD/FMN-containing dehydrogenase
MADARGGSVRVDVEVLRSVFRGAVISPADPGFEDARVLFNRDVRTRPALLCRCAGTDDVATAVRFARDAGLPIAVRGGGHHAAGFSLVEGGLVVDLGAMRSVSFDPGSATAVVQAGAGWRDVDRLTYVDFADAAADGVPFGYAVPGGECPTVSNAGYSLGGGYGLLGRRFGLACDHIVAAEVVDARGHVLRVTEDEHPDLLWALRGAGGAGLGVVTRLEYRLDPVPKTVFGGVLIWPLEHATAVLRAYRDLFLGSGDDRLSLYLALTTDPYPDGEPVVLVYGLHLGAADDAVAALAPLRALGPRVDTFGPTSYERLQRELAEEIPYGLRSRWRGGYFRDDGFSDAAFDTIVDRFRRLPTGWSMARFDLLGGGAIGRVPAHSTAFAHRSSRFAISVIALWRGDEDTDACAAWADGYAGALGEHLSGEVYQNYAQADLDDWPGAYYGANYPRLRQVKRRYDPQDVFRHPQSIRLP